MLNGNANTSLKYMQLKSWYHQLKGFKNNSVTLVEVSFMKTMIRRRYGFSVMLMNLMESVHF
jgi:hypothetical protein